MIKRSFRLLVLIIFPFLLGVLLVACNRTSSSNTAVTVGSKDFTESFILAEMYASVLENAGIQVNRKLNLGGTPVAHNAILTGQIDLYPEYTGTALLTILKLPANKNSKQVFDTVGEVYRSQFNLVWLEPSPMQSNNFIVVTREVAERYSIKTLSDMIENASNLRIVAPPEFLQREDGLPGLKKLYGDFDFKQIIIVDPGLRYRAITSGQADAVLAFSTDGELSVMDYEGTLDNLVALEDDRQFYPPYQVSPVVRAAVLEANPIIRDTLNTLTPQITDEVMRRLNYEVVGRHREPAGVAQDFLREIGLIKVCQAVCVKGQNLVREAIGEFNCEAIEGGIPIADEHGSLFGNIGDRQVDDFEGGIISGEGAMIFGDLADSHIHRLDGIGGVDRFTDLKGIVKEGNNVLPMGHPGFADGGVSS
jgi:osmoprotectant transport system substrate-binding protein